MSALGQPRRRWPRPHVNALPLRPESRCEIRAPAFVAKGHERQSAPQQITSLFDHLVGERQEGFRNCEPERLRLTTTSNLVGN